MTKSTLTRYWKVNTDSVTAKLTLTLKNTSRKLPSNTTVLNWTVNNENKKQPKRPK